jgi:hypothetical protein
MVMGDTPGESEVGSLVYTWENERKKRPKGSWGVSSGLGT